MQGCAKLTVSPILFVDIDENDRLAQLRLVEDSLQLLPTELEPGMICAVHHPDEGYRVTEISVPERSPFVFP